MRPIYLLLFLPMLIAACGTEENPQKIVFMENAKVFEEFAMKSEYDGRMEKELSRESAELDSLKRFIQTNARTFDKDQLVVLQQQYYSLEQKFNQRFQELSTKFTKEVNDRLNEYIKEYAESKGYDLILGSAGQGNVMYIKDDMNITEDLIKYVNKKFGE